MVHSLERVRGAFVAIVVDRPSPDTSRRSPMGNDGLPVDCGANYLSPALDQGTVERRKGKRRTP
jgi:hypothetical protein